jgi:hypothetical protein
MKKCRICCIEKELSSFWLNCKKKPVPYCKECWAIKSRDNDLKRVYGIDISYYNDLFSKQNGKCKICNRHQSEFKKAICVDHSHITGKVRGLLCGSCNKSLGLLKENKDIIVSMLKYLEEHQ